MNLYFLQDYVIFKTNCIYMLIILYSYLYLCIHICMYTYCLSGPYWVVVRIYSQ